MSQPKRYDCTESWGMDECMAFMDERVDGRYVEYSDYAALAAENERLRKAGDAMVEEIVDCYEGEGYDPIHSDSIKLWNAAKEGRDAK